MVKRYECGMYECSTGDYVAYLDYEKLVQILQYLVADHPAGLLPDKPKSLLQAVEAFEGE